jgi:UDP-glucose 4-epimerase
MSENKIFLTGVTGFIGSHLIKKLENYDVTCLVPSSDLGMQKIPGNVEIKFGDLTNFTKIQNIVEETSPNIIVHLAAVTPVRYSFEQPEIYQYVNYLGTINLVHAALKLPSFEKFIFASTMETYGWQRQRKPFTEDLPLNPASPYAVSKVAAEKYIKMAGKAFNLPYIIMKPCNTYGRKNTTGYIVEYLITKMLKNETPHIGTPEAVRDLMYVDDHTNAYIKAIEYDLGHDKERLENLDSDPNYYIFNFGCGLELTIGQVAEKIKNMIGYEGEIAHGFPLDYPKRPVVEPYLSLNSTKAKKIFDWEPKVTLEKGLKLTIDWWKEQLTIKEV